MISGSRQIWPPTVDQAGNRLFFRGNRCTQALVTPQHQHERCWTNPILMNVVMRVQPRKEQSTKARRQFFKRFRGFATDPFNR